MSIINFKSPFEANSRTISSIGFPNRLSIIGIIDLPPIIYFSLFVSFFRVFIAFRQFLIPQIGKSIKSCITCQIVFRQFPQYNSWLDKIAWKGTDWIDGLAEKVKHKDSYITKIETGRNRGSLEVLIKIAQVLDLPPSLILVTRGV
jgi:hypothetical protein